MEESGVKFLADEHISPKIVTFIGILGDKSIKSIKHPRFRGIIGMEDQDWIEKVTASGFICITCDRGMIIDNTIGPYLAKASARVIFIGKHLANSRKWDQALWWLRYWPRIRGYGRTMTPGQLAKVHKNGKIVPIQIKLT